MGVFLRKNTGPWEIPRFMFIDEDTEFEMKLDEAGELSIREPKSCVTLVQGVNSANLNTFLYLSSLAPLEEVRERVKELGQRLGTIFATFHDPEVVAKISTNRGVTELLTVLPSDSESISSIEDLQTYFEPHPRARELAGRRVHDLYSAEYRHAFTGSSNEHNIAIVKKYGTWTPVFTTWDGAQVNGRGVNGEFATLFARMTLHPPDVAGPRCKVDLLFASAFRDAYVARARLRYRRDNRCQVLRLMRSTFIEFGWSKVGAVYCFRKYRAGRLANGIDVDEEEAWLDATFQQGVWYIESAGDNVGEFLEESNWAQIKEKGQLIMSLFTEIE